MKQNPISIYIVEDDPVYGAVLSHFLSLNPDFQVKKFTTAKEFLSALSVKPDIVTLDYSLPDVNGDQLLSQVKSIAPATKVIIISGQENIKIAIELFKRRRRLHRKDNDTQERLWMSIRNLRENISLKKEIDSLQQEVQKKYNFQKAITGNSPAMKQVFNMMEKAASTNITVSITGETGTVRTL